MPGTFTADWMSNRIADWERIGCLDKFKGQPVHAFETGTFEGLSAIYFLDNILTHPESTMTCIDPYTHWGTGKAANMRLTKARNRSRLNLKPYGTKVNRLLEPSWRMLPAMQPIYSFCYIDADHTFYPALAEMVAAFTLLLPGGIMLIDDLILDKKLDDLVGANCTNAAFQVFKKLPLPMKIVYEGQNGVVEKL